MNKEELSEYLLSEGYKYEKDSEYNRDVFTNDNILVDGNKTKLEVYVDKYSAKLVWWPETNKRIGSSSYLYKLDEGILKLMVEALIGKR